MSIEDTIHSVIVGTGLTRTNKKLCLDMVKSETRDNIS